MKLILIAFGSTVFTLAAATDNSGARFFDTKVAPILTKRCLGCHNNELNDGGISFQDRDTLVRGGTRGPAIIPGKPESSLLIEAIRHSGDLQMPPGPKLPGKEISTLTEWVRRGAPWGSQLRK